MVDTAVVAGLIQSNDQLIQLASEGNPIAAAKLCASNGSEYVIVGNVTRDIGSSKFLRDSGMESSEANITAKVVNCSNAKIIASKSARGSSVHTSEEAAKTLASEEAAKKLMDRKLFEKIIFSYQDMVNNGITLDVTIINVKNFKTQAAVRKILAELPDVVSVNKRSFGKGQLKLSVLYKGNADSFSENVDGIAFQGKAFSVVDITGDRVVVQLE